VLTIPQRRIFAPLLAGEGHAFATSLISICGYCYGVEFLTWDPATIRLQLAEDIGKLDEGCLDKINAGIAAITDDNVFDDPVRFHTVMTTLYDLDAPVQDWDNPEVEEIAWGFTEALVLRGESEMPPISSEVAAYAGVVLKNEGFSRAPAALSWAKLDISKLDTFSDDPLVYQNMVSEQSGRAATVDARIKELTAAMMQQLESLQLGQRWTASSKLLS
jgi:hypothetical protein